MENKTFAKKKKILNFSLLVIFVLSVSAITVSAEPWDDGFDTGYKVCYDELYGNIKVDDAINEGYTDAAAGREQDYSVKFNTEGLTPRAQDPNNNHAGHEWGCRYAAFVVYRKAYDQAYLTYKRTHSDNKKPSTNTGSLNTNTEPTPTNKYQTMAQKYGKYDPHTKCYDLTNTQISAQLAESLRSQFADLGSAEVSKLTFCYPNDLELEAQIKYKHRIAKLGGLLGKVNFVEDTISVSSHGDPADTQICVDLPKGIVGSYGKKCKSIGSLLG